MQNVQRSIPFYKKLSIYAQNPLGIIGFCALVSGLFLFAVGVMNTDVQFIFKNEGEWIYTTASLLESREAQVQPRKGTSRTVLICTFQFEHKGGLTRKTITVEDYERSRLEIAGNTIQIQYKSYNPERAFPKGLVYKRANLMISGALIGLGLLLLLINTFVRKKFIWLLQHGTCTTAQNVDLKLLYTSNQKKKVKHKYEFRSDFVANERTYHTKTIILNLNDTDEAKVLSDLQNVQILYDANNPSDNVPLAYSSPFFKLSIDENDQLERHFLLDFFIGTLLLVPISLVLVTYIFSRFLIATFF
jgi:hypothetical protein